MPLPACDPKRRFIFAARVEILLRRELIPSHRCRIRRKARAGVVDGQVAADGGKGALWASEAFAHLAAHADRGRRGRIGGVEALGIDDALRMADVAAQRHRETLARCAIAAAAVGHGARDPEIRSLVRHPRQLGEDPTGTGERFIDIPQRAGAADPRRNGSRWPTGVLRCCRRDRPG